MRRRHEEEEHENHERWLVSYADFITLLFAFFVVMYSISSLNEGKYREVSSSMVHAFRTLPESRNQGVPKENKPLEAGALVSILQQYSGTERQKVRDEAHQIADDIRKALEPLVQDGQVRITEGALGIKLEINASVLFPSGGALLDEVAVRALGAVARVLAKVDFPIVVEGHTDNVPIATAMFPSNWELSAVRASSVVRLFIDAGVPATRLTAAGYADQRPLAANSTPAGRARNRRVEILIESKIKPAEEEINALNAATLGDGNSPAPSAGTPPPPGQGPQVQPGAASGVAAGLRGQRP